MRAGESRGRREFLRDGVSRVLGRVGDCLARRLDGGRGQTVLRPPGALGEIDFLATCFRCGSCAEDCPVGAILIAKEADDSVAAGPRIDPDRQPCVVCDDLRCIKACPSGALAAVESPGMIRMGLALVDESSCARSGGVNCRICAEKCPMGESALRIVSFGPPKILDPGCVGCGVCRHYCPTDGKAIVIEGRR